MNWKTIVPLAAILLLIVTLGLLQGKKLGAFNQLQEESPTSETTISHTLPHGSLIDANTKFAFHLFAAMRAKQPQENIFISPTSAAMVLAMTYNGAQGTTAAEMARALEVPEMSREEVNEGFQALALHLDLLNGDENVNLAIANSLWLREDFPLKEAFRQDTQEFYDAEATELDFTNPGAKDIINGWVKENTEGKIDSIVEQITPRDVLYLINAIYFQGDWTYQFDKNQTTEKPFYLANGKTKQQSMMSRHGEYNYYENDDFQAITLPYGEDRLLEMAIFLPGPNSNLAAFTTQLTPENWELWRSRFSKREGLFQMPRFKLEYEVQLNDALQSLGMKTMFQPGRADLTAMSPSSVYVNRVKHKTFLEVNEEGTEAAGVTSIGIRITSINPREENFTMIVDRPFFCTIIDKETGSILFMGVILEPEG